MHKKGTEYFNLPQWDFDEHPDFLDDMNPAYKVIDENLNTAKADSADCLKQLATITPIVEGLNSDMTDVQHDITDLQTRTSNVEHYNTKVEKRLTAVEKHNADIDKTLVGFDENDTVANAITGISESIEHVIYALTPLSQTTTFLRESLTKGAKLAVPLTNGSGWADRACVGRLELETGYDVTQDRDYPLSKNDRFDVEYYYIDGIYTLVVTVLEDLSSSEFRHLSIVVIGLSTSIL